MQTCPKLKELQDDPGKRGQRVSPRNPAVAAKIAKLEGISNKLSLMRDLPMLPFGTQDSEAAGSGSQSVAAAPNNADHSAASPARPAGPEQKREDPTNADIMTRLETIMQSMALKSDMDKL